jgi:glycosyltransferase involved in cell wall biosynthesis
MKCICIGNLRPVKGHIYAIEAMPDIIRKIPGSKLEIYGGDPDGYHADLAAAIEQKGLSRSVFLKGPTETPQSVISGADVILMPSLSEGFPLVPVEALSLGVPVVASDLPIHREILGNDTWGIITPKRDSAAIAEAVIRLAADTALYSRLSCEGAVRSRFFSRENMISGYIELYRSLMLKKTQI